MEIKKMSLSDLDFISKNLEKDYDDFWNYNILKSELENENSKYILAKQNGDILGFAGIWIAIDIAHITNIVVKKNHRKEGIGSLLLQELIKLCIKLDMKELTLQVNENNLPAINLYKKYGFEQVGLRKKYYHNTDAAYIMTIKL